MQSSPGLHAMFGRHSWRSCLSANSMIHRAVRAALAMNDTTGRLGLGSGFVDTDEDAHAPTKSASKMAAMVFLSARMVEPFSVR
jgi:hypothetical protein